MKVKLLVAILVICLVSGIGLGLLCNSIRKNTLNIESTISTFPKEGKLEVLSVSLEVNTSILKGETDDADYYYLYSTPVNGVYSIDLSEVEIDFIEGSNRVIIGIPTPEFTPYVNEEKGEKVFEDQKSLFSGSAQSGYQTFLEARSSSFDEMVKSMEDNQEFISMAKESAKNQITILASSMIPREYTINTYYLD